MPYFSFSDLCAMVRKIETAAASCFKSSEMKTIVSFLVGVDTASVSLHSPT